MNTLKKTLLASLAVTAAAAIVPAAASAAIVCNGENECWHTKQAYKYDPSFGLTVHENDWKWGDADHYTWREHEGRGYWRNGVWITF